MPKGIAGNARGQGPRSKIALADTKLFGIEEGLEETKRLTRIADKFEAPRPENVEEKYEITETLSQKEIILNETEGIMSDLVHNRNYEYRKWFIFAAAFLSAIIGVTICFAAMGVTVLFEENEENMPLLAFGCIFFIPFLYWFRFLFIPHPEDHEARKEIMEKRAVRTHEDRMRKEHLSGRLPRPIKVREEDKPPFEYDPDLPWMYIRQKPKPKLRVWFDEDGVAHKIEPGSSQEAQAIKEEEDMQFLLNGGNNVHRKLLGPKKKAGLAAFMEANGDGDEGDEDDEDNGRKSSAQE